MLRSFPFAWPRRRTTTSPFQVSLVFYPCQFRHPFLVKSSLTLPNPLLLCAYLIRSLLLPLVRGSSMEFPGGRRPQQQQQLLEEHLPPLPLARQGSVYSLTFDEFQSAIAGPNKDFGSMNMDELLRSIWTAEESQAVGLANASSAADQAAARAAAIQRQGSLTLPCTLSKKTVDEVWRNVMCVGGPSDAPAAAALIPSTQRQPTLGEITLEEFLVRAGVVKEDMTAGPPVQAPPPLPAPTSQPQMLFPQGNVFAPLVPSLPLANDLVTGGGGAASAFFPVSPVTSNGFGNMEGDDLSSLSPSPGPYVFNGGLRGTKPSAIEKVVERRQRRMIKNRESAARSRQRKQAYMMELEAEVTKLKDLNEELQKKQVEMLKKQKNEVLERMNRQIGPMAKRICLRRTLTGPW